MANCLEGFAEPPPPPLEPSVVEALVLGFHREIPMPSPLLAHFLVHGGRCSCGSNSSHLAESASTPGNHRMGNRNPELASQGARASALGSLGAVEKELRVCLRKIAQFLSQVTSCQPALIQTFITVFITVLPTVLCVFFH